VASSSLPTAASAYSHFTATPGYYYPPQRSTPVLVEARSPGDATSSLGGEYNPPYQFVRSPSPTPASTPLRTVRQPSALVPLQPA
jgi:hypothetical protein